MLSYTAADQKPAAEERGSASTWNEEEERDVSKPAEKRRENQEKERMTFLRLERVKDGRARVRDMNERVATRKASVYLLSS